MTINELKMKLDRYNPEMQVEIYCKNGSVSPKPIKSLELRTEEFEDEEYGECEFNSCVLEV